MRRALNLYAFFSFGMIVGLAFYGSRTLEHEAAFAQETAPVTSPATPLKLGGTTGAFPTVYLPDCETGGSAHFRVYSDDRESADRMTLDWSEIASLSTASTHDAIRITISAPMVSLSMTHARQEDHSECKRCGHALNVLPKDDPRFRRHQYEGLMSMEIRVTNEEGKTVFDGCLFCLAKVLESNTTKETK